jgi:competence protein ComQ
MLLLKGQDIDLKNQSMDLDGYWNLIVLKTGRSFSLITECGALTANTSSQNVKLLHDFGLHLGCIVQVLNDYRGFWLNQDSEDLLNTRYTLPIVYGITKESHVRSQLIEITSGPDWSTSKDQIHALLNEIDAKRFILTIALKERKKAIQVLSQLEGANQAFITILQSYLDVMFINIDELVEE